METKGNVTPEPCNCQGCGVCFPSRNAVFTHLVQTNGACLQPDEYEDFRKYVLANRKRQKVMILYGYMPGMDLICNGQDAALVLLKALADIYGDVEELTEQQQTDALRVNRSYGCTSRSTTIVQQDEGTGAINEVLATRLPVESNAQPLDEWLKQVNEKVAAVLAGSLSQLRVFGKLDAPSSFNAEMDVGHRRIECMFPVDLLVDFDDKSKASTLTDFFAKFPSLFDGSLFKRQTHSGRHHATSDGETPLAAQSSPPDQDMVAYLYVLKKTMQSLTTNIVERKKTDNASPTEKPFSDSKRIRERRSKNGQRSDVKESVDPHVPSENGDKEETTSGLSNGKAGPKRESKKNGRYKGKNNGGKGKLSDNGKKDGIEESSKFTLQRKRYHNFTPSAMAHEYLCLRRMDRFYHRATLRFDATVEPPVILPVDDCKRDVRPFLVLSLTGDVFLNGQASRAFGLFSALARGLIDQDFVDCIFDEHYPHLVPTPPLPAFAIYAGGVSYPKWEGKMKAALSPRRQNNFENGWNDSGTIDAVEEWALRMRQQAVSSWHLAGVDVDGRLVAEKKWTSEVLIPWAERAREHLAHYREWKVSRTTSSNVSVSTAALISEPTTLVNTMLLPPLAAVDPGVPSVFQEVLFHLRQANESGLWPSTTPKRKLVMVSKVIPAKELQGESPSAAQQLSLGALCLNAKSNVRGDEPSAYVYEEGQGGASGSFSVGAMPGVLCAQPKGNTLFPELMKAAFNLEIALCPDREPSSTIAINRNAQFRPHTDSGAGAGQSTSLIAGLGTYSGGELVVEGEQRDIRYKAIEFNGWKQRHWTMPFVGERFSLVWFTPKGCEGVHGIDLCQQT